MKNIFVAASLVLLLASCSKNAEPEPDTSTDVHINFKTLYADEPIVDNQEIYKNIHDEMFSVSIFRYYISHITFVKDDGTEVNAEDYNLVDAFDANYQSTDITLPNGEYSEIKFYLGVPQPQNGELSYEGDLNISNGKGMSWNWNFGYIFFKHEGTFTSPSGTTGGISLHLGTDEAAKLTSIPVTMSLHGNEQSMDIILDVEKIYSFNSTEVLEDHSTRHSTDIDDATWILKFSDQISQSFEVNY